MDKSLLLIIVLSAFNYLVAQESTNFAPVGAKWKYMEWSPTCDTIIFEVVSTQDTIIGIDSLRMLKAYRDGVFIEGSEILVTSIDDRVFFYENGEYFLLYDFSDDVEIGDTLEYFIPQNANLFEITTEPNTHPITNPYYYEILNIEDVELNNGLTKRKYLVDPLVNTENGYNEIIYLVEDIGSINTFIRSHLAGLIQSGCIHKFICYEDALVHYEENANECQRTSNTETISESYRVQIYPNPSSGVLFVDTSVPMEEIWVSDLYGNRFKLINSKSLKLPNDLKSSIAFLHIHSNNKIYTKKIIVIK